jgi:hypothetical protein
MVGKATAGNRAMKPTPAEVQKSIIEVMNASHPGKQTHADVGAKLAPLATPHRIAMNMDRLAKQGILRIDEIGSDMSYTKRYGLAHAT